MMDDYSEIADKTHVALIHETLGQSLARDTSTVFTFIALWSFGWFVGSPALEWIGVILGMFFTFFRALVLFKGTMDKRMTPDEARAWLDRNFPTTK